MNRIDTRFAQLKAANRTGLIPFITAGDPSIEAMVPVMHALVAAGADVIELGVPFSDPMADGPVIQLASERALARGVGTAQVFAMVRGFRRDDADTPVVLMGYLNPVEIYGMARYAKDAAEAGVDGLLLVDLPPEEADEAHAVLESAGLHPICLAAPTSGAERLGRLMQAGRGYLYYVSFAGVTGAAHLQVDAVRAQVAAIKALGELPVAVGFGVRDGESARRIGEIADAVVIGSALVQAMAEADSPEDAARRAHGFLAPIRAALDA
ncbi:MAG TPA: tryptophan synthase subunit alpha [Chiayiivirga sp.]|jgi:tryptophan synthase alpha chain|uniref:Tryptophan synthase alpha chain n=1 Tax=Denitratimonas tolerans TaxID=1338420 RepID=A0AAW9R4Y6_9GAMM|nr:tryptophan synthase subunit alpha [Xanthomonadaceae bacterium]MDX9764488.1 tryptophan synthase subunit alpha [Chiayiivirga sp.]MEB2316932.1 tryptophan synthase subunit alpha [Xanthomonadaceae bacterium]HRN58668.1 tryptophan synthase subunit alpha [Chiayiivirga sp.]HRQ34506.1 tryptophan synthase subunit alpha [Chiayiivirga sp.]